MAVRYRFDKDFDVRRWLALYHASDYNVSWRLANAEAMLRHAFLMVTAWDGDKAIGTLTVLSDGLNFAELEDVVVDPQYRGRGIGTSLVVYALDRLTRLVPESIRLHSRPGVEGFYERLGFAPLSGTLMYLRKGAGRREE